MTRKQLGKLIGILVVCTVVGSPDLVLAQRASTDQPGASATHQNMMAEMQATQRKLDELIAQMNAADGPAKVDRIAVVVTELVAIQKRMSTMMMNGGCASMMQEHSGAMKAPSSQSPDSGAHDHGQH
jgi:hypothetical protein